MNISSLYLWLNSKFLIVMKIAIPTKENKVDNHFGHCEYFTVYELNEDKEVVSVNKLEASKECGCKSNLAEDLAKEGVNLLIAGGIGGGAISKLKLSNIEVIAGFNGEIEEALNKWKNNEYLTNFSICTEHDECSH